ncbi:thioredoxin family protein [Endozoicomonas numazuensis]|uniref:Alkyl hydroperoxide reductase n=1 Tax=Endozoicomonas numazuensis TaxID=1137799 RepID=A0A081NKI9_9GAMM|nr:thioredoxin family protein [Endozoicomonas numazuensis]KEQ18962.1 alkyl hydroperoxide reductase [Endozoicomonas numazuensis]
MALTPSNMIEPGLSAPDFTLPDPATGQLVSLQEVRKEKGVLVMFICNHCPYVVHIEAALMQLGEDYSDRDLGIVAISSNDAEAFPGDAPEKMALKAYPFPYLYDESQSVAKAYDAACTPDFFLFDAELKCVYRGQFDNARPGNNKPATEADLKSAMEAVLSGEPVLESQNPSVGCNIKWK